MQQAKLTKVGVMILMRNVLTQSSAYLKIHSIYLSGIGKQLAIGIELGDKRSAPRLETDEDFP